MTCVPSNPRFRLLDHIVGWDAESADGLTGLTDDGGVRLQGGPEGLTPEDVDPYIPPPRLAPGCGPCDWYLATRPAPNSQIKALDGCSNKWRAVWPRGCVPVSFENAVAVAVDRHRMAVADTIANRVWVMLLKGAQIVAEIDVVAPRDISFGPDGEIVVAPGNGEEVQRFTFNGRPLGLWPAPLPAVPIARLAHDRKGRLWLATEVGTDRFELYAQNTRRDPVFHEKSRDELVQAFEKTNAVRSGHAGFCIERGNPDGALATLCWDWFGRPVEPGCVSARAGSAFAKQGQLLTYALDSGTPRCRWHRLILDTEIPAGTRVSVAVSASQDQAPASQGAADPDWPGFPVGRPHPDDWYEVKAGVSDALIRCPPGRYLFLRLRLTGDGSATPRVRRIHIDFPRSTSADLLPAVFREDGAAGDFTERFLALFDANLQSVDSAVARFPALLDGAGARGEVLPWIAEFLSVVLDETWDTETRRSILKEAPRLFRLRGTRAGLVASIQLAFGLREAPSITEHGVERSWGAVARSGAPNATDARLGFTRLFGRRTARMILNASPLGNTPVMSFGDPAVDPHAVGAFRFTVGLPASARAGKAALARLVEGQKPAHTFAVLREGATTGFRIGSPLRLGVDTLVVRPKPRALGEADARLAHNTVLSGDPTPGPVLGASALTDPRSTAQPQTCSE